MNDREPQSMVSRCDATTCRFNDDMNCTAGQIEVSLSGQTAQCLTFTPEGGMSDSYGMTAENN
ncbi:DUF1540 domain-containing protein [Deinococcus multiflagellatus]|uniref:DUF1540 domain-containing protein n=1 Tax=Deinococcus multiflagellatus TaxID=1656887 RepID=A0ABW1ZME2_9DEIO|nr:DUF1540 domain-containing protein [Deinococcus multiflagellatus]MBZ9715206.1 DUF1540 domain-containing protein [Deinococcus multiflagellatus]